MKSSSYTADRFWPKFLDDLLTAQARVLILSPFLGAWRTKMFVKKTRGLISKGVTICTFIQEPPEWSATTASTDVETAYDLAEVRLLIELLRSSGVHVNLLKKVHAKLAVIDESVLWEGSLNILSHVNAAEQMRRFEQRSEVAAVLEAHKLDSCHECAANHAKYATAAHEGSLSKVGQLIRKQRLQLGLSQRSLASSCGLPHSRISQIEAGGNITFGTLFQIMEGLQLEIVLAPKLYVPSLTRLLSQLTERQS